MATRRSVGYEDRIGRRKVTLVEGCRSFPWNSSRCSSGVNARPGIVSRPSGVLNFASGSGIDWLTTTRAAVASMTKATRNAVRAFTKTPRRVPGGSGWTERRYRSPTQRKAGGFRLSHLVRRRSWNLAVLHMRRSSRHDSDERLRGVTAGSVRTYLSAVWWLSDLISFWEGSRFTRPSPFRRAGTPSPRAPPRAPGAPSPDAGGPRAPARPRLPRLPPPSDPRQSPRRGGDARPRAALSPLT